MSVLIDLESAEGAKLLEESAQRMGSHYQPFIHGIFCKQVGGSTCGVQSAALVISAAHLGQSRPPVLSPIPAGHPEVAIAKHDLKYTEETMVKSPQTLTIVTAKALLDEGISLKDVRDVIRVHGYAADMHHAGDRTVDQFREDAIEAISQVDSSRGIVVNYHMSTLGQHVGLGHHSPLAAYHKETDRFLILDTWPATKECWATADNLFNAMNIVDDSTGQTRGYVLFHLQ